MTDLKGLGSFEGKTHILPIAVYYEDTDLSGVVYHANYLRYMERGRTEFFRLAGISKMAGISFTWMIFRWIRSGRNLMNAGSCFTKNVKREYVRDWIPKFSAAGMRSCWKLTSTPSPHFR